MMPLSIATTDDIAQAEGRLTAKLDAAITDVRESLEEDVEARWLALRRQMATMEERLVKLEKIPTPPVDPPPPVDPIPTTKAVLNRGDLEYQGAFVCSASKGMAIRRLNSQLRIFAAGSSTLSEYEIPDRSTWVNGSSGWPQAKLIQNISDTRTSIMSGTNTPDPLGLSYDADRQRLYWSFASGYQIPPRNTPSLAYIQFDGEKPVKAVGPFGAPGSDQSIPSHAMKIRGGSLAIPEWFAKGYLGGRTLGLGFGGYYSGWQPCSKGFHLSAAYHPDETTPSDGLDTIALIDHDTLDWDNPLPKWGQRATNYTSDKPSIQPFPIGEIGFWGYKDAVLSGGIWIDLPDKHGVLFFSRMGTGRVFYENSKTGSDDEEYWGWIYDPMSLAHVAEGNKQPYENRPVSWLADEPIWPRRADLSVSASLVPPSMAFDAESRTLFVLVPAHYKKDGKQTASLVHCFAVK